MKPERIKIRIYDKKDVLIALLIMLGCRCISGVLMYNIAHVWRALGYSMMGVFILVELLPWIILGWVLTRGISVEGYAVWLRHRGFKTHGAFDRRIITDIRVLNKSGESVVSDGKELKRVKIVFDLNDGTQEEYYTPRLTFSAYKSIVSILQQSEG